MSQVHQNFQPRKIAKPVTGMDVARKAGVSIATVSRVVNGVDSVRGPAREKVINAMRSLKYSPSRAAQRLRAQKSKVLGLIISDIQNPFFTAVVRGVEDTALAQGYSLVLCNSDEDPAKERLYVDVLRAEAVAGVIIASTRKRNPEINTLLDRNIPVVALDRTVTEPLIDQVLTDNSKGAQIAVNHLLDLGHTRIGFVGLPENVTTGEERKRGYILALKKRGIVPDREWMVAGNTKESGGFVSIQLLLAVHPAITAAFVSSNLTALGALSGLRDAHVLLPRDFSLIAFDDLPWSALLNPPLTTIAQPTYQLGQVAAETLLNRIKSPQNNVSMQRLSPSLVIRESTARLSSHMADRVTVFHDPTPAESAVVVDAPVYRKEVVNT